MGERQAAPDRPIPPRRRAMVCATRSVRLHVGDEPAVAVPSMRRHPHARATRRLPRRRPGLPPSVHNTGPRPALMHKARALRPRWQCARTQGAKERLLHPGSSCAKVAHHAALLSLEAGLSAAGRVSEWRVRPPEFAARHQTDRRPASRRERAAGRRTSLDRPRRQR